MFLARYFPGLHLRPADVNGMTPEETNAMRKAGEKLLKGEFEERWKHTEIVARAVGGRVRGI